MQYPERLLPKPHFCLIRSDLTATDHCLARHTPTGDIIDPADGKIWASCVAPQTDHLHDLSTNLLGTFTIEDIAIEYIGPKEQKSAFTDLWQPGQTVTAPVFGQDFQLQPQRGFFVLRIADIAGKSVSYNVGGQDGFTAVCQVLHTPIRANFWHFSIRWFNTDGDVLTQHGSWKRRLLTACRSLVRQFATTAAPSYSALPTEWYHSANP